jgi:uncharacterized protein YxjI
MELASLQAQQSLLVRQRITLMVNRYEVWDGAQQSLVCFAQQKRMAMKEQVTLYTDDSKTSVLAAFKARQVFDLGATYDVTDGSGMPLGLFRKDFAKSLLRSTWHLEQPGLEPATGQERSQLVAILRRFTDLSFLPYHFDFMQNGQLAMTVEKRWAIRDTYAVTIHNPYLDRRLVIAMAVALDALQAR